jgi:tetratricopeptide (TPR) repeat protein
MWHDYQKKKLTMDEEEQQIYTPSEALEYLREKRGIVFSSVASLRNLRRHGRAQAHHVLKNTTVWTKAELDAIKPSRKTKCIKKEAVAAAPQVLANPELWERLTAAPSNPAALNTETLNTSKILTEVCWKLSNSKELIIAETTLSSFLPTLKQTASSQPQAALLTSQGLQLRSILVAHQLKVAEKLALCQQAVEYARLAQDHNTLVAALVQLAVAYVYNNQYDKALISYQEALMYCGYEDVSPLLRSRTYVEAGAIFAHYKRRKEADFYLDMAYEAFPTDPASDPASVYADHNQGVLALYNGLIQLEKGEATQAWNGFESFKDHDFALPERIRLEIVNQQGRAALLGNDLEKYAYCLEEGLSGAVALKSKKRFTEAYTIFQQEMSQAWLQHHKIKPIVERYHLF